MSGSAIFSPNGRFRYILTRRTTGVEMIDSPRRHPYKRYGFFGVNPSTAGANDNDHTVTKINGFMQRLGVPVFEIGNPFALVSTDVRLLARARDPIGPDNDFYLQIIIDACDVLVPCWGRRSKVPAGLQYRLDDVEKMLRASGKPIMVFGLNTCGSPKHPLMLPYSTQLKPWKEWNE